jgi:hypothetical protein
MECLPRPTPLPKAAALTWIRTGRGYSLAGRYPPTRPGQASHNGST